MFLTGKHLNRRSQNTILFFFCCRHMVHVKLMQDFMLWLTFLQMFCCCSDKSAELSLREWTLRWTRWLKVALGAAMSHAWPAWVKLQPNALFLKDQQSYLSQRPTVAKKKNYAEAVQFHKTASNTAFFYMNFCLISRKFKNGWFMYILLHNLLVVKSHSDVIAMPGCCQVIKSSVAQQKHSSSYSSA